jgi:hypothetical protein
MLRANRTIRICLSLDFQSQELKYTSNSYFVKNFFAEFSWQIYFSGYPHLQGM